MKYKYSVRIHNVSTTEELMNEYGSKGIRVIKADFSGSTLVNCRQQARYTLYLEEKIKTK